MTRQLKAVVAGAGIGGVAVAIALRQAGIEVRVLERARELREIGAAVVVWPNGTRALRALGVEPRWLAVKRLSLLRFDGRLLMQTPVAVMPSRYGSGMMVVHRADLHSALLNALGDGCIRLGAQVTGFSQADGGVSVRMANGEEENADLLIGADGLRSSVRRQLVGDGEPIYQGFTAWRGDIPAGKLDMEPGLGRNWWGRGGEFLAFPLSDGRVYWAGTVNAPKSGIAGPGGHKQDALERFSGWNDQILRIVSATETEAILRTDIYDRPVVRSWSFGRTALLGDAAHPMTPSQGQGACQAIEDAVALGRSLEGGRDIPDAFKEYERLRLRRANRVVALSRQTSRLIQSENRWLCGFRDTGIRLLPKSVMLRNLDATLAAAD
jgi:2-polyprenyl-6-methoxyphenol hydroxylase-like FAD-dependent oxidoreductase